MISTNPAQAESIRVQLSEWKDALRNNFVLEPEGRNTAPAIALVALELVRRDPDAIMVVVPADHIVKGQRDFDAAVSLASNLAAEGLWSTEVQPIRPETASCIKKPEDCPGETGQAQGHQWLDSSKPDAARRRNISRPVILE
jgi:mannose-1-phosphate guanylyltransferase